MLEELPGFQAIETVYRFGNRRDPQQAARRMGLDEQAVEELNFAGFSRPDPLFGLGGRRE